MRVYSYTRKTISFLYIAGVEIRNDLAINDAVIFNCILNLFY